MKYQPIKELVEAVSNSGVKYLEVRGWGYKIEIVNSEKNLKKARARLEKKS